MRRRRASGFPRKPLGPEPPYRLEWKEVHGQLVRVKVYQTPHVPEPAEIEQPTRSKALDIRP